MKSSSFQLSIDAQFVWVPMAWHNFGKGPSPLPHPHNHVKMTTSLATQNLPLRLHRCCLLFNQLQACRLGVHDPHEWIFINGECPHLSFDVVTNIHQSFVISDICSFHQSLHHSFIVLSSCWIFVVCRWNLWCSLLNFPTWSQQRWRRRWWRWQQRGQGHFQLLSHFSLLPFLASIGEW